MMTEHKAPYLNSNYESAQKIIKVLEHEKQYSGNALATGYHDALSALEKLGKNTHDPLAFRNGERFFSRQAQMLQEIDRVGMSRLDKLGLNTRQDTLRMAKDRYDFLVENSLNVEKAPPLKEQYFKVPIADTQKALNMGLEVVQVGVWKGSAATQDPEVDPAQHFERIPAPVQSQQQARDSGIGM